ncbi:MULTISPECIES: DUF2712 domain-containing protein [unclassified Sporosarcina]|uniref:DUF2712 domain-containing protein n=1 Tax=unclassified Sporosarcina TaxID=2647733 RepID=UPI001A92FBA9|nr:MULTISPECIES: DUF2712 domain-containing protein [unclassified Sporosarcina]MBO0588372.1 DUF2712 domain-containing protein [Sporosarcina sp. E16_8]MBO0603637.1 DUF2712 domain-containing protein [Sporosarcina sp. E16_3]
MKKSRMLKSLFMMVLALGILTGGGALSSASGGPYTSYVLKPLGGNNYTNFHTKSQDSDWLLNKVTALTNTTAANFWGEYDGLITTETISAKYTQKVATTYTTISFYRNVKAGSNVRLAMENANVSTSNAFVSGDVEFW